MLQYKNVTVSFKYKIQSSLHYYDVNDNYIHLAYNNYNDDWFSSNTLCNMYWDVGRYDSLWQDYNAAIPDNFLTNDFKIMIYFYSDVCDYPDYYKDDYQYITIDSLVVTGNIKAESPENLIIVNNNGTMNLTWDTVADATQYYIYRSDKPDVGYQEIGSSFTASYIDDITGFDDGVYFYKVVSEVVQKIYQASGDDFINQRAKTKEVKK